MPRTMEEKKAEEEKEDVRKRFRRRVEEGRSWSRKTVRKVAALGKGVTKTERMIVLFSVGIVLGYGAKLAVRETVTIGYADYTLKGSERAYDLVEMERRQKESAASETEAEPSLEEDTSEVGAGATCQ